MKKLICVVLSLVLVLSLAACQPADNHPTNAPTNAPTDAPNDSLPTKPNPTLPAPTDPKPTEPAPTDPPAPAEMPVNGVCAVGIVDAEAGTAKVLADNGFVAEIAYSAAEELIPGELYEFAKNGDVYQLTPVIFINTGMGPWNPRLFDNSGLGTPDQLFTHDGTNGYMYSLTEDCVIFCRFSETEYRIFRGSDAIRYSDWPCWMYFNVIPPAVSGMIGDAIDGGTTSVILVTCDPAQGGKYANEATTFYFDPEGFGWSDGDLFIE